VAEAQLLHLQQEQAAAPAVVGQRVSPLQVGAAELQHRRRWREGEGLPELRQPEAAARPQGQTEPGVLAQRHQLAEAATQEQAAKQAH
jgi:hypothetical protein